MKQYTGKKVFNIEHQPTGGEITVEIDFDKVNLTYGEVETPILETIEVMVQFWTSSDQLIEEYDGDYVLAFLQNLCQKSLALQFEYYKNTEGVIRLFDNQEGYCAMDGSMGIKLLEVSEMELSDFEDYTIKEITDEK